MVVTMGSLYLSSNNNLVKGFKADQADSIVVKVPAKTLGMDFFSSSGQDNISLLIRELNP